MYVFLKAIQFLQKKGGATMERLTINHSSTQRLLNKLKGIYGSVSSYGHLKQIH